MRVVYDAAGKLVRCAREGIPGKLVFTTRGTAFGAGVSRDGVYSHREFYVEKGRFTLRRTVELPCYGICAVGKDGSVVGLDVPGPGDAPLHFTVYREGSRRAVGFVLPQGEFPTGADAEGHIYTMRVRGDGLVINCWRWPVPE